MAADEPQPVTVSRRIKASAEDIFRVLADPRRHLDIDGSGMLRGAARRHHGRDPVGHQMNWEDIGPGAGWPWVALIADELTGAGAWASNSQVA